MGHELKALESRKFETVSMHHQPLIYDILSGYAYRHPTITLMTFLFLMMRLEAFWCYYAL